jgi:hypothetical protein
MKQAGTYCGKADFSVFRRIKGKFQRPAGVGRHNKYAGDKRFSVCLFIKV